MKKNTIKMIVDILMLVLMILEYSKIYTGQLLHEIFGIALLGLFIIHNVLNINFYKTLFKGKYNAQRLITTFIDLSFLLCMLFTIFLGIPISEKIFNFLNLNGNMTIRKLHTIFGYWGLIILAIHLGLHFKMIFAKLKSRIKEKKKMKIIIFIIQIIIIIYGIKVMIDTNLGLYLIGKSSFAIPTSIVLSLINNLSIVLTISIIVYNLEKLLLKKEG